MDGTGGGRSCVYWHLRPGVPAPDHPHGASAMARPGWTKQHEGTRPRLHSQTGKTPCPTLLIRRWVLFAKHCRKESEICISYLFIPGFIIYSCWKIAQSALRKTSLATRCRHSTRWLMIWTKSFPSEQGGICPGRNGSAPSVKQDGLPDSARLSILLRKVFCCPSATRSVTAYPSRVVWHSRGTAQAQPAPRRERSHDTPSTRPAVRLSVRRRTEAARSRAVRVPEQSGCLSSQGAGGSRG